MQLGLLLDSKIWYIRTPVSGSFNGWSNWEVLDRQQALNYVEMGWEINYLNVASFKY